MVSAEQPDVCRGGKDGETPVGPCLVDGADVGGRVREVSTNGEREDASG